MRHAALGITRRHGLGTTKYYFVLRSTTMNCNVLQSTTQFYRLHTTMYYKVFRSISLLLDVLQSITLKFYYMHFFSQNISSPYKVPWRCVQHTEARETSTTTTEIKCHSKAMKHPRQSPEQPLRCKNTNESMLIQCDSNKHETSHGKDSENDRESMWNSNFSKGDIFQTIILGFVFLGCQRMRFVQFGKRDDGWGDITLNSQNPLARKLGI